VLPTLLTGATGLLGQYLLVEALRADWPLAVLARGDRVRPAANRIEAILQGWETRLDRALPRPIVIEGDLRQVGCGVADADRGWLARNCRQVVHCAASVRFQSGPDGEPWRSNVEGTSHLLELSREVGVRVWQHVSTAYVCGVGRGEFLETQFDVDHQPSNAYERSKVEAERFVRSADWLERANIFRPGIIVGDSRTGHSSTFHGFYAVLRAILLLKAQGARFDPRLYLADLGLTGAERKHLVPVDWVAATIAEIMGTDIHGDSRGSTYHLTPDQPLTVNEMVAPMFAAVREYRLPSRVARANATDPLPSDAAAEALEAYRSYFRDDPRFDTSHTRAACPHRACPRLDGVALRRMCDYALQTGFSAPRLTARPAPVDVSRWLAGLGFDPRTEVADTGLRIEVLGPGGGSWDLSFARDRPRECARSDLVKGSETARLDVDTLAAIVAGRSSSADALRSGQLVLLSEQHSTTEVRHRFELLCRSRQRSARSAAGARA